MQKLKELRAYSSYQLLKMYALIRKVIPDFRFIYVSPSDQFRTVTISDNMQIKVYLPWNYQIFEPSGERLVGYELTDGDRFALSHKANYYDQSVMLDLNKIIESYQDNHSSYYFAENIETLDVCDFIDVISKKAFLYDRTYNVMPITMCEYQAQPDPNEHTLQVMIDAVKSHNKAPSGYIPFMVLREYAWAAFHENRKIKLPYMTPSTEIRSLNVPKYGVAPVLVFTKDQYDFYDVHETKLKPLSAYYGTLSKVYPKCYPIPYWDFMKIISTSFKYKIIDTESGEVIPFTDAIYQLAIMGFEGRTTDKIRTMYMSLSV